MGKQEKLYEKLKTRPRDFTWSELETLLTGMFEFEVVTGSGSRHKFVHNQTQLVISLHKPHPGNELKLYVVDAVLSKLQELEELMKAKDEK